MHEMKFICLIFSAIIIFFKYAKVCAERGWRMYQGYTSGEERWNLWWRSSAFPAASYKTLEDWQVSLCSFKFILFFP